jgi:hypothetical protein
MMDEAKIELEVPRVLADEVSEYRKFLEQQFRLTVWSIGIVLVSIRKLFANLGG